MKPAPNDSPTVSEQDGTRYLHFDSPWIQGAMALKKPSDLVLAYTQQMMAWLLFLAPSADRAIGHLGLGAGSLARFCRKHLLNNQVVIERNASVIQICKHYFRLPIDDRLAVINDDAQRWVGQTEHHAAFAVLMVDLYDTEAQGPVCDSIEFYQACSDVLAPPGVLSVNLFGHHHSFTDNLSNLRAVFGDRLLILPTLPEGNQIVLAFKGPAVQFDRRELFERADWLEATYQLPARRWARSVGKINRL